PTRRSSDLRLFESRRPAASERRALLDDLPLVDDHVPVLDGSKRGAGEGELLDAPGEAAARLQLLAQVPVAVPQLGREAAQVHRRAGGNRLAQIDGEGHRTVRLVGDQRLFLDVEAGEGALSIEE